MKVLIIFDSLYGNTEKIALAIGKGLQPAGVVKVAKVNEVDPQYLDEYNLVVAGSPTQGGRPTAAFKEFLEKIPKGALRGVKIASFDTGIPAQGKGFFMRLLLKILGYAAPHIGKALESKGGKLALKPEGFLVMDKEGPLHPGEEERATAWSAQLIEAPGNNTDR